jgi:hypothetical protein
MTDVKADATADDAARRAQEAQRVRQAEEAAKAAAAKPSGVEAAAKTRDVVSAATVDNDRGAAAASSLNPAKKEVAPADPKPPPVTPKSFEAFPANAPTDPAQRGEAAAALASRSGAERAEVWKPGIDAATRRKVNETRSGEFAFRAEESSKLDVAAAAAKNPADKQQLQDLSRSLRENLPTDPASRNLIDNLAAGNPAASTLTQADAKLARDIMRDFPPTNIVGDGAGMKSGMDRQAALGALDKRVAELDATYARNGWKPDTLMSPGSPGRDQAMIASVVDRARIDKPSGPLEPRDFKSISPTDTAKGLQAIENFKKDNATIFGDPPPTDKDALQTREVVNQIDGSLRRHADIQRVQVGIDGVNDGFDKLKAEQGFIGKTADGAKNLFSAESGSNNVGKAVDALAAKRAGLDSLYDVKGSDDQFKAALKERTTDVVKGIENVGAQVKGYDDSQKAWVDGITTATATLAAVGAAPFTGGGSLGLLATGAVVGATTKVALKGADAWSGSHAYQGSVLGDVLKGGLAGATGSIAARVGQALVGSTGGVVRSGFVFSGVGTVDGSINGAGGVAIDAMTVRGKSLGDVLDGGIQGAAFGAALGGVGGAAGKALSNVVQGAIARYRAPGGGRPKGEQPPLTVDELKAQAKQQAGPASQAVVDPAGDAATTAALGGAARRGLVDKSTFPDAKVLYSQLWQRASLKDAVERFAPGAKPAEVGGKTIWQGDDGKQVVYDRSGNYFRVYDRAKDAGGRPLGLDGKPIKTTDIPVFKLDGSGKPVMKDGSVVKNELSLPNSRVDPVKAEIAKQEAFAKTIKQPEHAKAKAAREKRDAEALRVAQHAKENPLPTNTEFEAVLTHFQNID